jgi:hypothetical protein
VRGWERGNEEWLPPGYRIDTTDAAVWILRRPDGTVAGYFGVWGANRRAVERAASDDHRRRATLPRDDIRGQHRESSAHNPEQGG